MPNHEVWRMTFRTRWILVVSLALVACGAEPTEDVVDQDVSTGGHTSSHTLELLHNPFVKLPEVSASMAGDLVVVSTVLGDGSDASDGFETLQSGFQYVGWAITGDEFTALGTFSPGTDLSGTAPDATEIAISIEAAGTIGSDPAGALVLRGEIGEETSLGELDALSFTNSRAEVTMAADWAWTSYSGLPELPTGFQYEVWLIELDTDQQPTGLNISAGVLAALPDGQTERMTSESDLPAQIEVRVTVEAVAGDSDVSGSVCLKAAHDHSAHQ